MTLATRYGPFQGGDIFLYLEGIEAAGSLDTRSLTLNSLGLILEL